MADPTTTPIALALRAIQKYDEIASVETPRYLLIEAESHLGEVLGLSCTGDPDGWNADGSVAFYSHNGETCPVHEWLVESDGESVERITRVQKPSEVFVALRSTPDYTSPAPSFHSVHTTLEGATKALYPDSPQYWEFRKWAGQDVWEGPDGFGMVKKVELDEGRE